MTVYQNVQGLNTKTDNPYTALSQSEFDINAMTQTWFRPNVGSANTFPAVMKCSGKIGNLCWLTKCATVVFVLPLTVA